MPKPRAGWSIEVGSGCGVAGAQILWELKAAFGCSWKGETGERIDWGVRFILIKSEASSRRRDCANRLLYHEVGANDDDVDCERVHEAVAQGTMHDRQCTIVV